ncbi:MAG: hypothetical protein ABR955_05545 [Verrucomicrobiota bacterium]|jgi:hypothetical protein
MKFLRIACFVAVSFALLRNVSGQDFVNLNFESANVSGYPLYSTDVPISSALPGWSAYYYSNYSSGTNALTQVGYDLISIGSSGITVVDSNAPALPPLQGQYSTILFGSEANGDVTVLISQTGLVPSGTMSLLMDVYAFYNFEVTLGGQTINMIPLQTFPNYTLYGGNISSFAGDVETLSLIAPPTGVPNGVEFDDIQFSPSPVPEPSIFGLLALGGLFFGLLPFKLTRYQKFGLIDAGDKRH